MNPPVSASQMSKLRFMQQSQHTTQVLSLGVFSNGYVQKVVNNARTATPIESTRNSVITPIPLVNIAKRESVKRNRHTEGDVSAVKIKAIQSVEYASGSQLTVYSENKPAQILWFFASFSKKIKAIK